MSTTLLRTIRISTQHWRSAVVVPLFSPRGLYEITATTLQPLFHFTNLEHLCLDIGRGVYINDKALYDASKSWPKLKTLEFREQTRFPEPGVTFSGLACLARLCPLLETVSLRINGLSECDIPIGWAGENLTSLSICMSPIIPESHKAGRMFAKLFPKLQSVSSSWKTWHWFGYLANSADMTPLEKEYLDRWALINEYLSGPCRGRDPCVGASYDLWNPVRDSDDKCTR